MNRPGARRSVLPVLGGAASGRGRLRRRLPLAPHAHVLMDVERERRTLHVGGALEIRNPTRLFAHGVHDAPTIVVGGAPLSGTTRP